MFISYCCYSFIGQKAKMYIIGLKLKCQKACFFFCLFVFFLETPGEKPFFVFPPASRGCSHSLAGGPFPSSKPTVVG